MSATGYTPTEAHRAAICKANRARRGKPCSEAGRANIAAENRQRLPLPGNLGRWIEPVDFTDLDEPMIAMRLSGMSWDAVAEKIGASSDSCRNRMRALVAMGVPGALLSPTYSKRQSGAAADVPISLK